MVAFLLRPRGHAGDAGRNAHGAAGIHEDDGEPGAGGLALGHGFGGALVVAFAAGVVMDVHALEQIAVQRLRGFGGGLATFDQFAGEPVEIGTPFIAGFIERGIGQDVVQKDGLGYGACPREGFARGQGEVNVGQQKFSAEDTAIGGRHIVY